MVPAIFVIGLPGAGKSKTSQLLKNLLERNGINTQLVTDKDALELVVRREMVTHRYRSNNDTTVRTDHTIVLNPEAEFGRLQMVFLDGHALNSAHEYLMSRIGALHNGNKLDRIHIVEWAYGPNCDYPSESLRQDGNFFMQQLQANGLRDIPIIDVVANYAIRAERNNNRPGHIPDDEFKRYFFESGHLTLSQQRRLGIHYDRIVNTENDPVKLGLRVTAVFHNIIVPWLEREGNISVYERRRDVRFVER